MQQALPIQDVERDLDARIALDDLREQPRREVFPGGGHRDAQGARAGRAESRKALLDLADLGEDVLHRRVQFAPCIGHVDLAADDLEQRQADRLRQLLDLHRHGRLGHVQFLGRAGEAAQSGDGLEDRKLGERAVLEVATQVAVLHP